MDMLEKYFCTDEPYSDMTNWYYQPHKSNI